MKTLIVKIVNWYGRESIIPICETSHLFCELLKQKTLTRDDVNGIKKLGFNFKIETKMEVI
jgi:hypothetical protein